MATTDNTAGTPRHTLKTVMRSYEFAAGTVGDVIQMLTVLPYERVMNLKLYFDDLGTGCTVSVGDGDDPDRFLAAVDTASAGSSAWAPTVLNIGHQYTAQDTIDITVDTTATVTGTVTLVVDLLLDYTDNVS